MTKRSKEQIEIYIKCLEEDLKKKRRKIAKMQKENNESNVLIHDLKEEYLEEEFLKGELASANYILNNC